LVPGEEKEENHGWPHKEKAGRDKGKKVILHYHSGDNHIFLSRKERGMG